MAAAERANAPLLVAAGAFRLGFVFLGAKHYDQAEEISRTAADALWPLADAGRPEAMSLWGGFSGVQPLPSGLPECCWPMGSREIAPRV